MCDIFDREILFQTTTANSNKGRPISPDKQCPMAMMLVFVSCSNLNLRS
jgi:hypothetical protein